MFIKPGICEKALYFPKRTGFFLKRLKLLLKLRTLGMPEANCHGKCIINTVEERNIAKEGIRSKSLHSTVPTKWIKKRKI
jgi:hypothetical protein